MELGTFPSSKILPLPALGPHGWNAELPEVRKPADEGFLEWAVFAAGEGRMEM